MSAVPLVWDRTGSGPLVVLLHELTENRHVWDPVVDPLAAHCTVVRVDLRGHGDSPVGTGYSVDEYVADVREVIEPLAAELGRPVLVGHGFGAFVAADYATLHPATAVVDLDQNLSWGAAYAALRALPPQPDLDQVEAVLLGDSGYGGLSTAEQERVRALRRLDSSVLAGTWAPLHTDPRSAQAWAEQIIALPAGVTLTCVLATDPGKRHVSWLREHAPEVKVEGWPDGHYPHLVEPDRFVTLVVDQLEPVDPVDSRRRRLLGRLGLD